MLISLLLLALCLYTLITHKGSSITLAPLSARRGTTELVKFIASLLVVNGHWFLFEAKLLEWAKELNVGALCVSLFLMFSGYGLSCAYMSKGDEYLKGFIRHRLGRIILPLVTAYTVSLLVYGLIKGSIDWHNVLTTLYWGGPYLKYSWYVTEIAVLYLIFLVTMRVGKSIMSKMVMLTSVVILLIALLVITRQPIWYIISLPTFLVGLWLPFIEGKIRVISKPKVIMAAVTLSLLLFVFFRWTDITSGIECLSAFRYEYISMYAVNVVFVVMLLLVLKLSQNITNIQGRVLKCYYEVYLIQNCGMMIAKELAHNLSLYWILTMAVTILIALMLNKINGVLTSFIFDE